MLKNCIDFNEKAGIYVKYFIYNFVAVNEGAEELIGEKISFPNRTSIDDYGFGIVRSDGKTFRPVYSWIKKNNKKYSNKKKEIIVDSKKFYIPSGYPAKIN